MKNKKNDGKYVIIDDGTAGGLFLSENEYYVDENKKVVLCNSEKKDNLFRKRYKLTHGDKCYSIIKYFCPEVEFISIKIMETGERGSIDSFKAALEWCLKEKIKLVHMSVGTTNYIDAKKIENIIKQMVSNKMILCAALSNTNFPTWPACFDGVFGVRNYIAKLQEKEIWDFVGTFIKDPYSPQFDYVIFNIDRLAAKVKFDRYQVERQLSWALDKAVDQLVEIKYDENGIPLRLVEETGKMDTLLRLVNRGDLKRAETCRAKINMYELELAQKWDEVYANQIIYRAIKALGYSDNYLAKTVQYLAAYCPDKTILKKCLDLIEKLQEEEDKSDSKFKANYYDTLSVLYAKLGDNKRAKEFKKIDEELKAEKAKEFEKFLKDSK